MNRTELHYAALQGDVNRVAELLGAGVDPDVRDAQGFTPLHFAAQSYVPDIVDLLINAGANVNEVNSVGNTPLGVAVFNAAGRGAVIKKLLAAGANPDHLNKAGVSPRQLAERIANYDNKQFFVDV